jgi:hypothetical protein
MAKLLSKTRLSIGQGDGDTVDPGVDTFDIVGNITAATGPDSTKDEIEHTDMDSSVKEFFGDLKNPGNINVTFNRNIGNAGQDAIRADSAAQIRRNFKVERIDPSDASVAETAAFKGEVMDWSEDSSQGAPFTGTARIKITSTVTYT